MPFITLAVDGGLDLLSAPVTVPPGRLQAGSNFEVALRAGIKSVDGIERFDGGPSPSSANFGMWLANITGPYDSGDYDKLDTNFWATGVIQFDYEYRGVQGEPLVCDVIRTEATGATTGSIYFVTRSKSDSTLAGYLFLGGPGSEDYALIDQYVLTRIGTGIGSTASYVMANAEVSPGFQTVQEQLSVAKAYYDAQRLLVQEVPGQGNVLGLFWLKDELYACRDYLTLGYDTPVAEPAPDDELFIGASYAAATWKGFLAKIISTDAESDDISGVMMFYNTTGTATTGTIKNHSAYDADVATINTVGAAAQGAGLYRADGTRGDTVATQSWTHQELGDSVRFKDQLLEFTPANRLAPSTPQADLIQETDWVVAGTRKSFGSTPGNWAQVGGTGPEFIDCLQSPDGVGDTKYWHKSFSADGGSSYFWISNFGLTDADIPDGSAITGFTVEVSRKYSLTLTPGGGICDSWLKLSFAPDSGVGGDANFGNGALPWTASYVTVGYGGSESLLGYTNVTASDVKNTDFGFQMAAGCVGYSGTGSFDARVAEVKIKVHFIPPSAKIYFWNKDHPSPTAVVAEVVQSYKTSGIVGAVGVNNAHGTLFLMNAGTNRPVGADEEIRTYPADPAVAPDGGGSDTSELIATTETAMAKNVMDWLALLQAQKSKYQYDTHNFYAAANFDAIYGVSGAGPAFMYDDYAFTKILTGTPAQYELPRHVIAHQQRLFLGYGSGQYMWGETGEPLQFNAVEGTSAEDGVGSAIRGFMQLNGDALAIFNQRGVNMIQGDVGLDPYPGVLSPDVGTVEYSAQSMGNYMYMSFRGAQNLRATPSYGDFDTSQFSWDVWDWLRPRVQTSASFESANIGLINSYPVRNKSQCRWCFADGAQLTATFLREGELPQFTIQNYTNSEGDPLTWDVLTAGVESTGRDRIFGATNDGTGYVYEIDRGYSFDGANIDAYATLAVMDQGVPEKYKEFTDAQVHGKATDYASFTMSRAKNYGKPDPSINYQNTFGSLTAAPTGEEAYFSSAVPTRLFGRNIVIRFDRSSNNQPPVTIQALSYNIVPAGDKHS